MEFDCCLLQLKQLMYFGVVACVFLFAYGVAVQSLLYPNAEERWWHILYAVFYRPYLSIFETFDVDELSGMYCFLLMHANITSYKRLQYLRDVYLSC